MLTREEYLAIRRRMATREVWAKPFVKRNGWTVIPAEAEAACPEDCKVTNEERSLVEEYEFISDPPGRYFLYVFREGRVFPEVGTWTGRPLGRNVDLGPVYRSSFGDERQSIRFTGINGLEYCGTYYCGAGDYARVRLTANSRRKLASRNV